MIRSSVFFIILILFFQFFLFVNESKSQPIAQNANKEKIELTSKEKIQRILSIAKPSTSERIFYRWQSETSGNTLLKEAEYTEKRFNYFMGMTLDPDHFVMGQGVYYAEDITSSAQFIRGDGKGSLIEVHVPKDTPVLDLTSQETLAKLNELGIQSSEIRELNPPIAIKYNARENWWVIKKREGVQFKSFDPSSFALDTFINEVDLVRENPNAIEVLKPFLISKIEKELVKNPDILFTNQKILEYFPREKFVNTIKANPKLKNIFQEKITSGSLKGLSKKHLVALVEDLGSLGVNVSIEDVFTEFTLPEKIEYLHQKFNDSDVPSSLLKKLTTSESLYLRSRLDRDNYQKLEKILNRGISANLHDPQLLKQIGSEFALGKITADGNVLTHFDKLSEESKLALRSYISNYLFRAKYSDNSSFKNQVINSLVAGNYTQAVSELDDIIHLSELTPENKKIIEKKWIERLINASSEHKAELLRNLDTKLNFLSLDGAHELEKFCRLNYSTHLICIQTNRPKILDQAALLIANNSTEDYVRLLDECLGDNCWSKTSLTKVNSSTDKLTETQVKRLLDAYSFESYSESSLERQQKFSNVIITISKNHWNKFPKKTIKAIEISYERGVNIDGATRIIRSDIITKMSNDLIQKLKDPNIHDKEKVIKQAKKIYKLLEKDNNLSDNVKILIGKAIENNQIKQSENLTLSLEKAETNIQTDQLQVKNSEPIQVKEGEYILAKEPKAIHNNELAPIQIKESDSVQAESHAQSTKIKSKNCQSFFRNLKNLIFK
jgi:hypothetical protein